VSETCCGVEVVWPAAAVRVVGTLGFGDVGVEVAVVIGAAAGEIGDEVALGV
jgi:hypothetical protein